MVDFFFFSVSGKNLYTNEYVAIKLVCTHYFLTFSFILSLNKGALINCVGIKYVRCDCVTMRTRKWFLRTKRRKLCPAVSN